MLQKTKEFKELCQLGYEIGKAGLAAELEAGNESPLPEGQTVETFVPKNHEALAWGAFYSDRELRAKFNEMLENWSRARNEGWPESSMLT